MTTMLPSARLARTGSSGPLSGEIIPATPGTFYVYDSMFTPSEPLYALMDCKANKRRSIAEASDLGHEVHLHFECYGAARARVSSIKTAKAARLLGDVDAEFDDVYIAPVDVAIEDFYALCAQRDSAKLIELCKTACSQREVSVDLAPAMIIAITTGAGKYGLFLVKELSPTSVSIDACHILSP